MYSNKIVTKEDAIEELVSLEKEVATEWDPMGHAHRIRKVTNWVSKHYPANAGAVATDTTIEE